MAPTQIKESIQDPEGELSKVLRTFQNLAPKCSVKKRGEGEPQLAPQEKQISILKYEMKETLLCINLAKKGLHALRDANIKRGIKKNIKEYESLTVELTEEKAQDSELDLLNYLSKKVVANLIKKVPSESDELAMLENANTSLRRMENRLDMATKKFCRVNADNEKIREEIHRLMVERNDFNLLWQRIIGRLEKGKEYLMDIFEIAATVSMEREECCRKLEDLKWRGLQQLNKDINEMYAYESDLNHLAKLEEFLRVKGSRRICEADEIAEVKKLEEIAKCEQAIAGYDALLDTLFEYTECDRVVAIIKDFKSKEISNDSIFILLCETLQECIMLRQHIEEIRQRSMDFRDWNEAREEKQDRDSAAVMQELADQRERTQAMRENDVKEEELYARVMKGIEDMVRLMKCDTAPLLKLLGNHKEVTRYNVMRFIDILEMEVKSVIEVVYGAVKPPAPTPKSRKAEKPVKLVADPHIEFIRPNRIEKLVPYQPCAYCVEDYMMNQVFETPAVPADPVYCDAMLHLEAVNTNFGIFTLTKPSITEYFQIEFSMHNLLEMSIENDHIIVKNKDELSRVQRTCKKLAPLCSVEKRARGEPQLAPQKKQIGILKHEMEETQLYIDITKQRRNKIQIAHAKKNIYKSVLEYENFLMKLREEKAQQTELEILNYLANKHVIDLSKEVPTENDAIEIYMRATTRLRRMENRLDLATKRLCSINTSNQMMREEIHRLLVERKKFNIQWQQAIGKLVRGKDYLMDMYEGATAAFAKRDEYCKKLEILKWKGLVQLNKDIGDMQYYGGDINYLANLEEFIRVKSSTRVCEADEKEQMEMEEEISRCEQAIAKYDNLLQEIFDYAEMDSASEVIKPFRDNETKNLSLFIRLCDELHQNIFIRKDLETMRQRIVDAHESKEALKDKRIRQILELKTELEEQRQRTQHQRDQNLAAEEKLDKLINGIHDLVRLSNCDITPFLKLLGKKYVTKYNVHKYLKVLELEVKDLVQVVGAVKPPVPTSSKGQKGQNKAPKKIVADPHVEIIRPNKIEKLVNYLPCAYCVEDYIMNLVYSTPAVPADEEYLQGILHLDEPNTKFGIYTLTVEGRRHLQPEKISEN